MQEGRKKVGNNPVYRFVLLSFLVIRTWVFPAFLDSLLNSSVNPHLNILDFKGDLGNVWIRCYIRRSGVIQKREER